LIAAERELPVVIDDLVCQLRVAAEGHVAANSHTILQTMVRANVLAPIEYENALLGLHKLNYQFLRISAADLYLLLKVSPDDNVSDFALLSGQLSNPACDTDSVIRVAVCVLLKTWFSDLHLAKKVAATHLILLASNLNRPFVISYQVRDRFIEEIGPQWNSSQGRLDGVLRLFLESWRHWADQVRLAAARVRAGVD
jgi:hypothetical protein